MGGTFDTMNEILDKEKEEEEEMREEKPSSEKKLSKLSYLLMSFHYLLLQPMSRFM